MTKKTLLSITFFVLSIAGTIPTALASESTPHNCGKTADTDQNAISAEILLKGPLVKGKKAPTEIEFFSKKDHTPLLSSEIQETHTEKIHLLIFDQTLTDYQHIHPTPTDKPGIYQFEWTPKEAHQYRLWADLALLCTNQQEYIMLDLGDPSQAPKEVPKAVNSTQKIDELTYTLSFDAPKLISGKPIMGKVTVEDAQGRPFTGLEPVMGAFAHIVAMNEDFKTIAHVHPMGVEPTKDSERGGPELDFHIEPNKPGFWKIWVQVKIHGKNVFVPFGVDVK
ncbi:MAG: hypothetical protein U1A05_01770 [Alphaproteobacteria bacterium]|nr:hypothetical protein [Alphaproteobacteria bacterium]